MKDKSRQSNIFEGKLLFLWRIPIWATIIVHFPCIRQTLPHYVNYIQLKYSFEKKIKIALNCLSSRDSIKFHFSPNLHLGTVSIYTTAWALRVRQTFSCPYNIDTPRSPRVYTLHTRDTSRDGDVMTSSVSWASSVPAIFSPAWEISLETLQ